MNGVSSQPGNFVLYQRAFSRNISIDWLNEGNYLKQGDSRKHLGCWFEAVT